MPETRRSARQAGASSGPASSPAKAGSKRKAGASPKGKKNKKTQKTLEETVGDVDDAAKDDIEMEDDVISEDAPKTATNGAKKDTEAKSEDASVPTAEGESKDPESGEALDANTGDSERPTEEESKDDATGGAADVDASKPSLTKVNDDDQPKSADGAKTESNGNLVEDNAARDDKVASNIIEKGIIYFFTRGRVNIEEPEGVHDLQRTYFVLRPIPTGAKLGEGPIDDSKRNRLIALPKKIFPQSGKDRFMAFVEKGKASMSELKEGFFQGSDYETKTGGQRHTPSVTPIGEGVYAITKTNRTGHLVYMLTIPKEPGELQDEMGIRTKGSFVLSLKNPKNKGPANAQLSESPDFPEEIMNDFGGLAWMPVHKSEYLDYPNAQLLLIGEGQDKFGSALEGVDDKKDDPEQELEKLEDEDQIRVQALHNEDAVFEDLHIKKGDYPEVKTTW